MFCQYKNEINFIDINLRYIIIDIQVTALCAGVHDSSVLVQRSALDLLLVGFPVHNSQLGYDNMVSLLTAALVTILRRDMSLNRHVKFTVAL